MDNKKKGSAEMFAQWMADTINAEEDRLEALLKKDKKEARFMQSLGTRLQVPKKEAGEDSKAESS